MGKNKKMHNEPFDTGPHKSSQPAQNDESKTQANTDNRVQTRKRVSST